MAKTLCNIIIVEDDRIHADSLFEELTACGHCVVVYRDLATLRAADTAGHFGFHEKRPLVIILDTMLAKVLDPAAAFAPRYDGVDMPPADEQDRYVDDELGLQIGIEIREGDFKSIPPGTPILFVTARDNDWVRSTIRTDINGESGSARHLVKPVWSDDVESAIQDIVH